MQKCVMFIFDCRLFPKSVYTIRFSRQQTDGFLIFPSSFYIPC